MHTEKKQHAYCEMLNSYDLVCLNWIHDHSLPQSVSVTVTCLIDVTRCQIIFVFESVVDLPHANLQIIAGRGSGIGRVTLAHEALSSHHFGYLCWHCESSQFCFGFDTNKQSVTWKSHNMLYREPLFGAFDCFYTKCVHFIVHIYR